DPEAPKLQLPLTAEVEQSLAADDEQRLRRCLDSATDKALAIEAWDIARCLSLYLTQGNLENQPVLFVLCSTVLRDRVSKIGSAKEVLLVLMEALDCFKDDCRFEHLIPSVRNCLSRAGAASAEAALEVLGAHIQSCEDPPPQLEGEELALMQSDPETQRALRLTSQLVQFMNDLLQDAGSNPPNRLVRAVTNSGLKLLEKPLLPADLCWTGKDQRLKSDACELAAEVTKLLTGVLGHRLVDLVLNGSVDDVTASSQARLALAFVVLTGACGLGAAFPQVYSSAYLMRRLLPVLSASLSAEMSASARAALTVLNRLLLSPDSLDPGLWDLEEFVEFWSSLQRCLIHHPASDCRKLALDCLSAIFAAIGPVGRHRAILRSLHSQDHPSCRGFFISRLKDQIALAIELADSGKTCQQVDLFTGSSALRMLEKAFSLPRGAVSDMLEEGEALLAGLNLLKFLTMRDGRNRTLFWNKYQKIQETYLDEMRTGFNMSMAHYKAEYRNPTTEEDLIVPAEEMRADGIEPSISVGGVPLPPMSRTEKRQVMREALNRLELLVFVHGEASDALDRLRPSWVAAAPRPEGDANNPYVRDATEVTHIPNDNWDPSDLTV
ncbi:hypothetical protein BOX15_Mlig015455g3, partial [Macrostomum lignano]